MKLGMTSMTLKSLDVFSTCAAAKNAGLDGIEWGVCDTHVILGDEQRCNEIKSASKKYGLEIFSLGSYFEANDMSQCEITIKTAVMLGAPVIRIWAGNIASDKCSKQQRELVTENIKQASCMAAKYSVNIGIEYHGNSLTDTPESAIRLIKDVSEKNCGLYWQPTVTLGTEKNLEELLAVKPYLIGNLHIQNYTAENGYGPLSEIEDSLLRYYADIKRDDFRLMIEFVADSKEENLLSDAATLKKVAFG